ncbi:MAG: Rieske 2Fe-2S domain-containing protein [Bacteroidales bacterium]|nr:Rieske 2Fe-2S domain-containing protein [Bacteroidales bacterium]
MKRIISHSNLRFFLISILILLIFVRCDDNEIPFPNVSVYTILSVDTQLGNILPQNYVEIDGYGIGGLIIYRVNNNSFLAFDRACTYEASPSCILQESDEYIGIFDCPCCGSGFWMIGEDIPGTVQQGPANVPLKQYRCFFNGANSVTVTN